ncbi:MAG: DUF4340 domain-containing protein, partial [Candidatus Sumerlaeota bacterium]
QVVALTFVNDAGTFRVERVGDSPDAWRMTEPRKTSASDAILNAYVENLRGAKRQAEFAVDDPTKFGFDKPREQVVVTLRSEKGGTEDKTLIFGNQPVPFGPVYTMIKGEPKGFTTSEWLFRQSAKDFDALRDRSVVHSDVSKTLKYRIETRNKTTFELERQEPTSNDWFVIRPGEKSLPADRGLLDRQLVAVSQAAFVEVADNPTSTTAQLGLDDPVLKLYADGKLIVELGDAVPDKEQLFARNEEGTIGIVTGGQFVNFLRPPVEWGTKKFIWIRGEDFTQIETASGNSSMNLLLDKGKWIFADSPDVPIEPEKFQAFTSALQTFSAQQRVKDKITKDEWEQYGIIDKTFHATVTGKGGMVQGFRFGFTDSKEGFTYVMREQDDSLWKVDLRAQNAVFKFRSDLIDKRLLKGVVSKTTRVEIQVGDKIITLEKTASAWRSAVPGSKPVLLPPAEISGLLSAFEGLEEESRMLGGKKGKVLFTFRFYENKATEPFIAISAMDVTKEFAMFEYNNEMVEVPYSQFKVVDDQMAKVLLDTAQTAQREAEAAEKK